MKWNEHFNINREPSYEDIKQYIGEGEPLWSELLSILKKHIRLNQK